LNTQKIAYNALEWYKFWCNSEFFTEDDADPQCKSCQGFGYYNEYPGEAWMGSISVACDCIGIISEICDFDIEQYPEMYTMMEAADWDEKYEKY
jgi:hypothetical protein